MDQNASSADEPREGVIDVERLDESWWPPAADSFPQPRGLNGADWRALRAPAGALGSGANGRRGRQPVGALPPAAPEADVALDGPDDRPRRRLGWIGAIVPLVIVGAIAGVALGNDSNADGARTAIGTAPSTTVTTAVAPSTVAPSSTAATTTVAPVTTVAPTTAPAATTVPATTAPATTAPATTAPATTAPATTAPTAPPVTLATAGDPRALDDLDVRGLSWWGELRDGTILLRGRIASREERDRVKANAALRAGDGRVVEQLVIDPSVAPTAAPAEVPLFITDRVYFSGTSSAVGSDYGTLVGFAQFSLRSFAGVTFVAVVRTPASDTGSTLARARGQAVVDAVLGEGIDRARLSVSTVPALGGAAGGDAELQRRDGAVLMVLEGVFGPLPGA